MPAPAAAPSETIERPEAGLAAGRWEAPAWAFVAVAAAAVLGALAWLLLALRTRRQRA